MAFQRNPDRIEWRLHLRASPERVFAMVGTAAGRRQFWAESADEADGVITFRFPDGSELRSRIVEHAPPNRFAVEYFGGAHVLFECAPDGTGGTDLRLVETGTPAADRAENIAGWVSVLLCLKAAADHGVDLRNHDPTRTWADGYVDN
jgi:uncharacterized protein YndB with AHSA1/START domain